MKKRLYNEEGFSGPEAIVIFLFVGVLIFFTIGIFSSGGFTLRVDHNYSTSENDDSTNEKDSETRAVVNNVSNLLQGNIPVEEKEELGKVSYTLDDNKVTIKAGDTVLANDNEEDVTIPDGVKLVVEGKLSHGKTYYIVRATHEEGSKYNKDDHTWCVSKYYEVDGEEESISNDTIDYKDSLEKEYP